VSEEQNQWKRPSGFAWTAQDVARELKVSACHVYRLASQNKIPFAKVGKLVRFSPDQIAEWIRKGGTK
jgi:excisionase family DNA binding protein